MRIKILLLTFLSSFILSALAAVPSEINYQGLITDPDGNPIESATNSVAVNLYQVETGGTSVYTESFTQVASDANGIYSIQIGGASLQSVLEANNELWLELIINQQTLSPRQKINSVPYALVAKSAESIAPGSDADAAIASLQAFDVARPSQAPVLLAIRWNYPSLNSVLVNYWDSTEGQSKVPEIGDRILITEQINASENGIYEVESLNGNFASLVRADDYNSAEEINAGDFVFVQKGDNAGQGYILGALPESFELGVNNLNFSRFTIDTTLPVVFDSQIEARELRVQGPGGSVNFDGSNNYINGSLYVNGYRANFESVDEMLVPTPDQDNEATNKAYVDAAVATNTSALAVETSARAAAITALQADIDQNESDADAAITAEATTARAAEQANADDIFSNTTNISNNTTNISNNSADIATNSTNISANTGNVTTNTTNISLNATAITAEVTRAEAAEAVITNTIMAEVSRAEAAETALQADIDQNESDADAAIAALQAVDASSARQFVVDFGFTDNKSNLNSISLSHEELYDNNTGDYYSCEIGDTVLLTGQSDSSENGIYEITAATGYDWSKTISLARSLYYDTVEEFNEGDLVLIEKGGASGLAFMLGAISETFVLGNDALTWYRCGIDTNQDIEFTGIVTVTELRTTSNSAWDTELRLGQSNNYFNLHMGDFEFRGNFGSSVDFRDDIEVEFRNYRGVDFDTDVEFNSTVTVQAPTQDDEVANKAYVDGVVVPPGGLVAWPVASGIPTGWSDAGLSSPMTDYIWIRKD